MNLVTFMGIFIRRGLQIELVFLFWKCSSMCHIIFRLSWSQYDFVQGKVKHCTALFLLVKTSNDYKKDSLQFANFIKPFPQHLQACICWKKLFSLRKCNKMKCTFEIKMVWFGSIRKSSSFFWATSSIRGLLPNKNEFL